MIKVKRLPEPAILAEKRAEWQANPLVSERRRMLQRFNADLIKLSENAGWRSMSAADRQRLLAYRQPDSPFSLMFAAYLDELKLADD